MMRNLILLVSAILLVTSIFECYLQIIDYPTAPTYGWTYASEANSYSDQTNELASRGAPLNRGGPKPLTPTVIVLLGDSQVECGGCSFNELPERRLEKYLNSENQAPYQVFSIAASGWGQDQELLMLAIPRGWHNAEIVEYGKYLIPGLDDVWSLAYLTAPRGRLGIDSCAGRGDGVRREKIEDVLIYGREPVWEEKSHFNLYSRLDTPRLIYGLRLTSDLLKDIARVAAEHHADFMIFTAGQFYSDRLFRQANDVIADFGNYCLEVSREAFERRIGTLLREFDYVDVTPAGITDVYANNNQDPYLSAHGTDEAMRQLAEYIRHQQ